MEVSYLVKSPMKFFIKVDTEKPNKHKKICSLSHITWDLQLVIIYCYCTPTRMVKIKFTKNTKMLVRMWSHKSTHLQPM